MRVCGSAARPGGLEGITRRRLDADNHALMPRDPNRPWTGPRGRPHRGCRLQHRSRFDIPPARPARVHDAGRLIILGCQRAQTLMVSLPANRGSAARQVPVAATPAAAPRWVRSKPRTSAMLATPTHRAIPRRPIDRDLRSQVPPHACSEGIVASCIRAPRRPGLSVRLGQIRQPSLVQAHGCLEERQ